MISFLADGRKGSDMSRVWSAAVLSHIFEKKKLCIWDELTLFFVFESVE